MYGIKRGFCFMSKKLFVALSTLLLLLISSFSPEQNKPHSGTCPIKCTTCQLAIDKALCYLSNQLDKQKPDSFADLNSALTGLAFLAAGNNPNDGKFSSQLRLCSNQVLSRLKDLKIPKKLFDARDPIPLSKFNAVIALETIFLTEYYKSSPKKQIKQVLLNIEKFFKRGRYGDSKGWGYTFAGGKKASELRHDYANMFSTHVVVIALIQMRDAGLSINEKVLQNGISFISKLQRKDKRKLPKRIGEFVYFDGQQKFGHKRYSYSPGGAGRTAGALYALLRNKKKQSKNLEISIRYLKKSFKNDYRYRDDVKEGNAYNLLLLALAMHILGNKTWNDFWNHFRDSLLKRQKKDGSWKEVSKHKVSPRYFTSIYTFIMLLPRENLPLIGARHKKIRSNLK